MRKQPFRYVMLTFLTLSLVLFAPYSFAQSANASAPSMQWSKTYSGVGASYIIQTSDQGYLLVSSPLISTPGTLRELIKTDFAGNMVFFASSDGIVALGNPGVPGLNPLSWAMALVFITVIATVTIRLNRQRIRMLNPK